MFVGQTFRAPVLAEKKNKEEKKKRSKPRSFLSDSLKRSCEKKKDAKKDYTAERRARGAPSSRIGWRKAETRSPQEGNVRTTAVLGACLLEVQKAAAQSDPRMTLYAAAESL